MATASLCCFKKFADQIKRTIDRSMLLNILTFGCQAIINEDASGDVMELRTQIQHLKV
jgi:hypothetical protein